MYARNFDRNCGGICKQCNLQMSEIPDGSYKKTSYLTFTWLYKIPPFVETHLEEFY